MDYQQVGNKIRKLRMRKHLTQEEFAEETGLSVCYVGQIERGQRKAPIKTLEKIGETLDVPLASLLHDLREEEHINCIWKEKAKILTQEEKESVLTAFGMLLDLLNKKKAKK